MVKIFLKKKKKNNNKTAEQKGKKPEQRQTQSLHTLTGLNQAPLVIASHISHPYKTETLQRPSTPSFTHNVPHNAVLEPRCIDTAQRKGTQGSTARKLRTQGTHGMETRARRRLPLVTLGRVVVPDSLPK